MKRHIYLCVTILVCIILVGCSYQVHPTINASEFSNNDLKLPKTVAVYFTDEFRNYAPTHTDVADMKKWELQIGPMATDAFTLAYQNRFQNVIIRNGMPQFPIDEKVDLVIIPKFTHFNAGEPMLARKFENFWLELAVTTVIYDSRGRVIFNLQVIKKGTKNGLAGGGFAAYPALCEEVVKPLVIQSLAKTVEFAEAMPKH